MHQTDHKTPLDNGARAKTPKKASGQDGRKARRELQAREQAEHARRLAAQGKITANVEPCREPIHAHLWQLQRLLDLQMQVETDAQMTLQDKIRNTTAIAMAMGRISTNAECEREAEELMVIVDQRVDELKTKKRALQVAAHKQTCVECRRKMSASA